MATKADDLGTMPGTAERLCPRLAGGVNVAAYNIAVALTMHVMKIADLESCMQALVHASAAADAVTNQRNDIAMAHNARVAHACLQRPDVPANPFGLRCSVPPVHYELVVDDANPPDTEYCPTRVDSHAVVRTPLVQRARSERPDDIAPMNIFGAPRCVAAVAVQTDVVIDELFIDREEVVRTAAANEAAQKAIEAEGVVYDTPRADYREVTEQVPKRTFQPCHTSDVGHEGKAGGRVSNVSHEGEEVCPTSNEGHGGKCWENSIDDFCWQDFDRKDRGSLRT